MSISVEQGASPEETVKALGADLLQLNLSAYQLGHHGLAHHLLSAALHCAQGSGDSVLADGVWQRAEDQRSELMRTTHPGHGPTDRVRDRSTITMFDSVAVMAASLSQRLKSRRPPMPWKSFVKPLRQIP